MQVEDLNIFVTYNDLCEEIAILETQLELCIKEREQWWMGGRLFNTVQMDTAAEKTDRLSEKIAKLYNLLDKKKAAKKKIDEHISNFQGLDYKVAFKRYCEGKTIDQIAEELGYSEIYIKKISAGLRRKVI